MLTVLRPTSAAAESAAKQVSLVITDVTVKEVVVRQWTGGIKISTTTQIHRDLLVSRVPVSLDWGIAIDFKNDDKSTVTVEATVFDPTDKLLASSERAIEPTASVGSGRAELSPLSFTATVTGKYTVRLFVGDTCVWTESIVIAASNQ